MEMRCSSVNKVLFSRSFTFAELFYFASFSADNSDLFSLDPIRIMESGYSDALVK
jgi:hypothetical protein